MKSGVKTGLTFLGGVIFGGGVSFVVTYKLTEKKWKKISDERVESLHEYIDKLQKERIVKETGYATESDADDISEDSVDDEGLNSKEYKNPELDSRMTSSIKRQNEATYVRYSKLGGPDEFGSGESAVDERYNSIAASLEHPQDSDEDEEDNEDEIWSEKANSASPPIVIDESEFGSTGYLDEVYLLYYPEDDLLTTEEGQIILDQGQLIGDLIEETGFRENSVKDLYVRNYRRSTDYDISKVWGHCPASEEY